MEKLKRWIYGKIALFVDVANLFYLQKRLKWKISYQKLYQFFDKNFSLYKAFVYTAYLPQNENQQRFIRMLRKTGYTVRSKPIKNIKLSSKTSKWKGNLDVELTIDAIEHIRRYDTFVLISGDSDFASLIDYLKSKNKQTIVISGKGSISKELIERAKFVNIKKLKEFIELA